MLSILGFSRFNAVENMVSKTIKEPRSRNGKNIPLILTLLDQFQADEVIKEDSKIIENIIKLVYLLFFYLITSHMDLETKKLISRGSLEYDREKSKP